LKDKKTKRKAKEILLEGIENNDSESYVVLSNYYLQKNKNEKAKKILLKGIKKKVQLWFQLGEYYNFIEKNEIEYFKCFNNAIKDNVTKAITKMIKKFNKKKQIVESDKYLKILKKSNGKHNVVYFKLKLEVDYCKSNAEKSKVFKYLKKFKKSFCNNNEKYLSYYYYMKGRTERKFNNYNFNEQSIKYYIRGSDLNNFNCTNNLIINFKSNNDQKNLKKYYKKYLKLQKSDYQLKKFEKKMILEINQFYFNMGNYSKCLKVLNNETSHLQYDNEINFEIKRINKLIKKQNKD
jgi:hypothetical protein